MLACLVFASPVAAQSSGAAAQKIPVRLPDLSSYSCERVASAVITETRHVGQYVNGRYNEWLESYISINAQARLGCISLLKPEARPLTATEAAAFLTASLGIGAPHSPGADAARSQSAPEEDSVEPLDVKPEPLKRIRPATPGISGGAEQKSGAEDTPPLPASKSFDPQEQDAQPAPVRERAKIVPAPQAKPAFGYETPQTVGVDDRTVVPNTQTYPFNTIGYLSVTYPNGDTFRCSGTLVSPYVVLTAGHCIHNLDRGGYVATARFYPGQYESASGNPIRPYGSKSNVAFLKTTAAWTLISGEESYPIDEYRHDYAAIQFQTAFTHTSTFMPVIFSSTTAPITSVGYPGVVNGQTAYAMFTDSGGETAQSFALRSDHLREFSVDATGGNSGGPFIYVDPSSGQNSLVGSLSYADDLDDRSGGPWYDSWNQTLLSGWVSWTPGGPTAGSVAGLRLADIFSSTQLGSGSYLRFYNSGTSAGTVDVTLANYLTGELLATWTSPSIPARSSPQYFIETIENSADVAFTRPDFYSISVRPTFSGYLQHALWRRFDGTLTNLSTCDTGATSDAKTLVNVHSSLLQAGYPSTVIIHNTGTAAVNVSLGIYNARTGTRLDTYTSGSIPANGQKIVTTAAMEVATNLTPAAGVLHYNIRSDTNFTGYLQHLVHNVSAGVTTDMTAVCRLAP